ncbi:MAG: ABC transporter permease [Candidatus Omnitrophota bacterium]|jgi:ABC-type polysaccharide/polyol phosphate export permease|nr:MAG: ABC transporter permease [Candidatus Omnitrophota bacterium]
MASVWIYRQPGNFYKSMMKTYIHHLFFQRYLLWEFLSRDLQARYVGSAMGFFWSIINPIILLLVYSFVFGVIIQAKWQHMGVVNPIGNIAFYIFCGLLPWYAFQESVARSTTCIVDNAHLIKQVRFPAKILPAYITLSSIINQLIGTAIFLITILAIQGYLPVTILALPFILILEFFFFFGAGLLFSTLNTYIRDIAPLVTIMTMIMMWSTPMLYPIDMVPDPFLPLIYANPITYFVMIHHQLIYYGEWPTFLFWAIATLLSASTFTVGYSVFTRCHREFADLL